MTIILTTVREREREHRSRKNNKRIEIGWKRDLDTAAKDNQYLFLTPLSAYLLVFLLHAKLLQRFIFRQLRTSYTRGEGKKWTRGIYTQQLRYRVVPLFHIVFIFFFMPWTNNIPLLTALLLSADTITICYKKWGPFRLRGTNTFEG